MNRKSRRQPAFIFSLGVYALAAACLKAAPEVEPAGFLSPTSLQATGDGKRLFVGCATANRVAVFDTSSRRVIGSVPVPASPSGLALSDDATRLFVTCSAPESQIVIIDVNDCKIVQRIQTGHSSMGPILARDGRTLYVRNRFENSVGMIDLTKGKQVALLATAREPVAAALTPDEKHLLVVNFLPSGRADQPYVGSVVTVLDVESGETVKELPLPDGSGSVTDIQISPNGRFAAVTLIVGHYKPPTVSLEMRWMNGNALALIDVSELEVLGTVLLDDPHQGAANPSACAWSSDGKTLVVTHAGTHELSVIDFEGLLKRVLDLPAPIHPARLQTLNSATREEIAFATYLRFFPSARERIRLPEGDLGPRAVTIVGHTAYVANYFSDTLSIVDLSRKPPSAESVRLGPDVPLTPERKGEFYFHDAGICYQGWQSCASCHPGEARADGLNWDLRNDGRGNPKNTKSLLFSHATPPAMSLGVRDTAETAVRSGIKHILNTEQPEAVAQAIDAYLKSLKPIPSPHLRAGVLSPAAMRGKQIFERAGCSACHPAPLFTNLKPFDVGTAGKTDKPGQEFDTPTLVEVWRTAPYLHDGSAPTIREVLTIRNPRDQHGTTSVLSFREIEDLCAYVLSH